MEQTFQDFEVIIVNDGSTDNGEAEVRKIKDERITLFTIENLGVSYARNFGIDKSNAEFIAFLDADDHWYPNHLKDLRTLVEQFPDCGLYAKGYESVFHGSRIFKAKFMELDKCHFGIVKDYFHHSLINQIAWTSAVAIPKKILNKYGHFDTGMKSGQDTDLWTRIALNEKVAFDPKISAQKIMTTSQNHLSKSSHVSDRIHLLGKFKEQERNNVSFKKYMDYNRFSIALERKMAGDLASFKKIKNDIHPKSLNRKQQLLLNTPGSVLKSLKQLQNFLLRHQIYLSAFR